MTDETRKARLVEALVDALGVAINAAQADGETGGAAAALARLLEQWRAQLADRSPAALEPTALVIGFTAIFALCDVRLVDAGPHRGVHIDGDAVAAFDAALRLIRFQDRHRGTTLGEEAMVALLGGFMADIPSSTPDAGGLH